MGSKRSRVNRIPEGPNIIVIIDSRKTVLQRRWATWRNPISLRAGPRSSLYATACLGSSQLPEEAGANMKALEKQDPDDRQCGKGDSLAHLTGVDSKPVAGATSC